MVTSSLSSAPAPLVELEQLPVVLALAGAMFATSKRTTSGFVALDIRELVAYSVLVRQLEVGKRVSCSRFFSMVLLSSLGSNARDGESSR